MGLETKILAGVALFLIVLFAWLLIANANLRADLAEARASNTALHLANDAFKDSAERQAKNWAAMQADAAQRYAAAQKTADRIIARYKKDAAQLKALRPQGGDCAAAAKLIDSYREKYQ